MREIKFRGKHIHAFIEPHNTGIWVYGYLCDDHYINSEELMGEMLVDKDTIGQYTGLHDKNGKEIYEGDIVKYDAYWEEDFDFPAGKGQILWDDEETGFYLTSKTSSFINLFNLTRNLNAEIIGNIYDNPELLEE